MFVLFRLSGYSNIKILLEFNYFENFTRIIDFYFSNKYRLYRYFIKI